MEPSKRLYRFYSNDAGGATGQAPASQQGQDPTPGNDPSTSHSGQAPSGDAGQTLEQLRSELARARADASKVRVDAKELETLRREKAERDAASLTETQKAAQRAEAAEAANKALRDRVGIAELRLAAQAAGISDPDLVSDSLSLRSALTFDDAGEPTNVASVIAAHKAAKPHLYAAPSSGGAPAGQPPARQAPASSGGATNPGRSAGNGSLTREMIEAMPPHELIRRHAEIKAWQAAQNNGR